jgi:hypothetical protein
MDWLVNLCGLPDKFICKTPSSIEPSSIEPSSNGNGHHSSNGSSSSSSSGKFPGGVIQGTSSEAVLVAMLAARARALAGKPPEAALKLVAYGTNQVRAARAHTATCSSWCCGSITILGEARGRRCVAAWRSQALCERMQTVGVGSALTRLLAMLAP